MKIEKVQTPTFFGSNPYRFRSRCHRLIFVVGKCEDNKYGALGMMQVSIKSQPGSTRSRCSVSGHYHFPSIKVLF